MMEKYPIVTKSSPNQWDFVLTIEGIFVAISQLNHEGIPQVQKEEILDAVTRGSIELYPDAVEACEDCRQFVDRAHSGLKNAK